MRLTPQEEQVIRYHRAEINKLKAEARHRERVSKRVLCAECSRQAKIGPLCGQHHNMKNGLKQWSPDFEHKNWKRCKSFQPRNLGPRRKYPK